MKPLSVAFLGTCSGGGPLLSRACTATAVNFDGFSWLVDCAEGTQTQILRTHGLRIGKFNKIFITHLHVDHVMGLIPLLRTAMYNEDLSSYNQPRMQIYGPSGLRSFVRFNLNMTEVGLTGKYAVHELLGENEKPGAGCRKEELHQNEIAGVDFRADADGIWRGFAESKNAEWTVDAGPLVHRARCIGYVFREAPSSSIPASFYIPKLEANAEALLIHRRIRNPLSLLRTLLVERKSLRLPDGTTLDPPPLDILGRKLVILGDTSDPSLMIPIAMDASLLVHESTNAYIPKEISEQVRGLRGSRGSPESVRTRSIGRGHSTADMAGEFAKRIRARRLFLNHFSTMFCPGGAAPPLHQSGRASPSRAAAQREASLVMTEIERQASEAWGMGNAVAARDLMVVDVPQHEVIDSAEPEATLDSGAGAKSPSDTNGTMEAAAIRAQDKAFEEVKGELPKD